MALENREHAACEMKNFRLINSSLGASMTLIQLKIDEDWDSPETLPAARAKGRPTDQNPVFNK